MTNTARKTIYTTGFLITTIILIFLVAQGFDGSDEITEANPEINDTRYFNPSYKLPDTLTFAGETVPMDNFDTRESLDREILTSAYRHSSTILIIKRANRYFPVIEKILKQYDIPDDFKYLVAAESEFHNAISPVGATGFWQIMPNTGREEGMEINSIVDERYHIEKSTEFACRYFLKSFQNFGNWTLVAASYNGGRAGISNQIKIQNQNNYYDLLLTEETARYIFRVIAYKLVISDPARYGFKIDKEDLYPELKFYEVKVDTSIADISEFALKFGTNYKMIKFLNPWLRKPYLTPKPKKTYMIKIPSEGMRKIERSEN
jgi:membrane-bound lytic murein transglycosylase D